MNPVRIFRFFPAGILTALLIPGMMGCTYSTLYAPEKQEKSNPAPHLQPRGDAVELIVDGQPYPVLGGELGNSSFTSFEYMKPIWPKLKAMNLNTVLAPVYWELIEPKPDTFDFELLDNLIQEARSYELKLILLWYASWKNSMSSHAPAWVKTNQAEYPRVRDEHGESYEILTPFSDSNRQADMKAFRALLGHLKETDSVDHTVIMIQPENEIGMLPSARDHYPLANEKFSGPVPDGLMQYLLANRDSLVPELAAIWEQQGSRTRGTWEEVFGKGTHTDEIFMAWYYARYVDTIASAGKAVYPLPMYVNAALNYPGRKPGKDYPSGGPLPHLMDIWKAGAPAIDFLAPDLYTPHLTHWCDLYTREGNPLFIPEHSFDHTVAAKALYTFGHYESIGFSPYSIESTDHPEQEDLGKAYHLLAQLAPVMAAHRGKDSIDGVLLDKEHPESILRFGDYEFTVRHSHTLGWEKGAGGEAWEPAGAVIIQTGAKEFYVAGSGIVITFRNRENPELKVGILQDEEGRFRDQQWEVIRYLNGDQTHQGRHLRIFLGDYSIQRLKLYDYW